MNEIIELLSNFEDKNEEYRYGAEKVQFESGGDDLYIVSDLHLASGCGEDGKYAGTENFFADDAFYRFLNHLQSINSKRKTLIINGDCIDFLRIVRIPESDTDFSNWQNALNRIGIEKSIDELKESITAKEKTYGLKTPDYKSVWKVLSAYQGHTEFFKAISFWLKNSNRIIFVKGNHDLELYWNNVRNFIRILIAENIGSDILTALKDKVLENTFFIDNILLIDKRIYISHGHVYDKYTHVIGSPTINNNTEINIPFGSFFNRYLINKVELNYSFVDNIRPAQNVLPLMLKERFFTGLKLLFYHIPFTLKIIPKQYYRYMFSRFLIYLLAVGLPLAYTGFLIYKHYIQGVSFELPSFVQQIITLGFSYLLSRLVAFFHLTEPSYLDDVAAKLFKENPDYEYFVMGHTHNPDIYNLGKQWYFNTGTWIPIIEFDSEDVRHDKTYLFTHFEFKSGLHSPAIVYQWNDDAGREERFPLIRRKS